MFCLLPGVHNCRNDTIHPHPPVLRRILCITKKEYKRIKVLVGRSPKRKRKGLAPSLKNKKGTRSRPIIQEAHKAAYEPSNIAQAHDNQLRRWIRVKQWFNDYKDDYTLS